MDIGKSFTYVFDDPQWITKVLIGGAIIFVGALFFWLLLIPLLVAVALVLGYTLTTTRNVAEGAPVPLPAWGDMGALFMKGLYALIGIIIYFLPVIILGCCFGVITGLAGGSTGTGTESTSSSLSGVAGIAVLCLQCIIALYSFVAGVTLYAPLTRFAMSENQLSVFWDIRGNLDLISKNAGPYVIALLVAFVASFIAEFGIILCAIGLFFTTFWAQLVTANLFGQFWRQTQGPAAPVVPVAPVTPA